MVGSQQIVEFLATENATIYISINMAHTAPKTKNEIQELVLRSLTIMHRNTPWRSFLGTNMIYLPIYVKYYGVQKLIEFSISFFEGQIKSKTLQRNKLNMHSETVRLNTPS